MKKNNILFSLSLLALTVSLCSIRSIGAEETASLSEMTALKQIKMQFTPPQGWHFAEMSNKLKHVHVMVLAESKHELAPCISLGTDYYQGELKDYLKIVKQINDVKGDEWKDLGKIQTEAGEASLSQVNAKTQWGEMRMMHAILLHDGIAYILTTAALKEDFPAYYKEFFQAMRSLKFIDNDIEISKLQVKQY